jgi:hypothetical protein
MARARWLTCGVAGASVASLAMFGVTVDSLTVFMVVFIPHRDEFRNQKMLCTGQKDNPSGSSQSRFAVARIGQPAHSLSSLAKTTRRVALGARTPASRGFSPGRSEVLTTNLAAAILLETRDRGGYRQYRIFAPVDKPSGVGKSMFFHSSGENCLQRCRQCCICRFDETRENRNTR